MSLRAGDLVRIAGKRGKPGRVVGQKLQPRPSVNVLAPDGKFRIFSPEQLTHTPEMVRYLKALEKLRGSSAFTRWELAVERLRDAGAGVDFVTELLKGRD